jgi:hypothetical protein
MSRMVVALGARSETGRQHAGRSEPFLEPQPGVGIQTSVSTHPLGLAYINSNKKEMLARKVVGTRPGNNEAVRTWISWS